MENAFVKYVKTHWGSQAAIAKAANVSRGSVCQWKTEGIPPNRVLAVESVTGIPRHVLRPDIYPPPAPDLPQVWSGQNAD